MNAKACWIATLNRKGETPMKNPFPVPKSDSPFVPNVGDRVSLVEPLWDRGIIAGRAPILISPAGRQGFVINRVCGVYEVRFDHEADHTRHVFQDQLTILRRHAHGGAARSEGIL